MITKQIYIGLFEKTLKFKRTVNSSLADRIKTKTTGAKHLFA